MAPPVGHAFAGRRRRYAAIRELREKNWIAAHIRERRYELELAQQDVAKQAGTSHSFISKLEAGDHIPTIPVLKRILAVLDEELPIGIQRRLPDEEPEREVAPVPELAPNLTEPQVAAMARPAAGPRAKRHSSGAGAFAWKAKAAGLPGDVRWRQHVP